MRALLGLLLILAFPASVMADPIVGETSTYAREQGKDQLFYYVSGGNGDGQMEYICAADAGRLGSEAKWQIRKFSYDSSNRLSSIRWADGTDNYTKICDNRASLDYEP